VALPAQHVSVLAREVGDALAPCLAARDDPPQGVYVDATCGLGGHAEAILRRFRPSLAVLFDRDPHALEHARRRLSGATCPLHFVQASFATLPTALANLEIREVAAIVADLGVSSLQLDDPGRGFSWRFDSPLDMRMDPTQGESAAELLARIGVPELTRILREYGEEPDAGRIARELVRRRPATTTELAQAVSDAMSAPQRRSLGTRIHPATRTFQALRIHVNGELDELDRLLADAPGMLMVGGRLAILSFHSLEDRRIKRRFRELAAAHRPPAGIPLAEHELPPAAFVIPAPYRQGKTPTAEETSANPRARSARLRVLERAHDDRP
jgi:16S rRNA (cytosine1402-N4)-methyltransferase